MVIPGAMHPDPVRGSHSARATAWSTLDGVHPVLPAGASRQPPLAWHGNGGRRTHRKGAVAQGEGRSGEPTSSAPRRPVCGRTRVWQQYQFERKPCALAAPPATPQGTAPRLRGGRGPRGLQPASRSRTEPAGPARRPRGEHCTGLRCSRSGRKPGVPGRPRVASGVALVVPPPGNPQRRHRRDPHQHLSDRIPPRWVVPSDHDQQDCETACHYEQNQPEPPHRAHTSPRPGAVQCHQTGRGACWGARP